MPRLAEQFLHHIIMLLRPVEAFFQLPAIDDVADQIQRFAAGIFQEMQQRLCLRAWCAEMCVGNPDSAEVLNARSFVQQDRRPAHR